MKRRVGALIVLVGAIVFASAVASAQVPAGIDVGASQEQLQYQARLAAALQNRAGVEQAIVQKWAAAMEDGGAELTATLAGISLENLLLAEAAETIEALDAATFGKAAVDPLLIGDPDTDLVFFPVTPCRIVDTRNTSILVAGVARHFDSNLGSYTAQGGSATNCGIPVLTDTAALAVTFTVLGSTAVGNLRAWPYALAVPNASVINYGNTAATSSMALANTTILPLRQTTSYDQEFSVRADGANVHLIMDVVGYFWSPAQTAVQHYLGVTVQNVAANVQFNIFSPACPGGTRVLSGGWSSTWYDDTTLTSSRPVMGSDQTWLGSGTNIADRWLVQGNNHGVAQDYRVWAVCGAIPGR